MDIAEDVDEVLGMPEATPLRLLRLVRMCVDRTATLFDRRDAGSTRTVWYPLGHEGTSMQYVSGLKAWTEIRRGSTACEVIS